MARSRKKLAKRSSRGNPVARSGPSSVRVRESVEQRLTREIVELDLRSKTRVVQDVVAIGQRMAQLQHRLGFGQWLSWLSQHLPFSPRTAQRYIAVAQWAADNPADFEHFSPLGLGKLQRIAALSPQERARIRRGQRFQIPGTTTRKTLALMTLEQLDSVIRGMGSLAARPAPPLPPGKILQRFRHRVAGLDALADQLREHASDLSSEDIEETIDALESVVSEMRGLLS